MRLVGLMLAHNEDWVIGTSARAALLWCDHLIILDHNSTDRTPQIVQEIATYNPGRVSLLTETDPAWNEMACRQRTLDEARRIGATHCAIVDADEILTANLLPVIRGEIEKLSPGRTIEVGMLAMWRSLYKYRTGHSIWSNRTDLTLAFCDQPSLCWTTTQGYDHHHRAPLGITARVWSGLTGGVMHLQWASWRRLVAKHAKYKMMERIKYPAKATAEIDRMYSLALDESDLIVSDAPIAWWDFYHDWNIKLDAVPQQEAECQEWMKQYGTELFNGLDLFGVA